MVDRALKKRSHAGNVRARGQKQIVRYRHHQDRDLSQFGIRAKAFDKADSVQPRQFVVGDNKVRSLVVCPVEGLLGAVEIMNGNIRIDRLDYLAENLPIAFDIIDDNDRSHAYDPGPEPNWYPRR